MSTCSCKDRQLADLPNFSMKLNEKTFTIKLSSLFEKKGEDECKLLMYPVDMSTALEYKWVVGDKFLFNFYTIFDN